LVTLFSEEEGCVFCKFETPRGLKAKTDIAVKFTETELRVAVKGEVVLEGPLRHAIRTPSANKWGSCETRWFVEDDKGTQLCVIQMEKVDKAQKWLRLFTPEYYVNRAEAGDTTEQINLAFQYDQKGQPAESFLWWKRAADEGNSASAQLIVASKYHDGVGCPKSEEKYQEYYIHAALNKQPHPTALLQVGVWLREGTLGSFGKERMLGYTHQRLWEQCVDLFPAHQDAKKCAQLLAHDYLLANNIQKAEKYARAGGIRLEPKQIVPQQPPHQQQQQLVRASKLDVALSGSREVEGEDVAGSGVSHASGGERLYNLWSWSAFALAAVAAGVVVFRAGVRD